MSCIYHVNRLCQDFAFLWEKVKVYAISAYIGQLTIPTPLSVGEQNSLLSEFINIFFI